MRTELVVTWSDGVCNGVGRNACGMPHKRGDFLVGLQTPHRHIMTLVCLGCASRVFEAQRRLAFLDDPVRSRVSTEARRALEAALGSGSAMLAWLEVVESACQREQKSTASPGI